MQFASNEKLAVRETVKKSKSFAMVLITGVIIITEFIINKMKCLRYCQRWFTAWVSSHVKLLA